MADYWAQTSVVNVAVEAVLKAAETELERVKNASLARAPMDTGRMRDSAEVKREGSRSVLLKYGGGGRSWYADVQEYPFMFNLQPPFDNPWAWRYTTPGTGPYFVQDTWDRMVGFDTGIRGQSGGLRPQFAAALQRAMRQALRSER